MKKRWLMVSGILLALAGCSSAPNTKTDYTNYKGVWMDNTGNTVVEMDFENGKDKASITMKQNNGVSKTENVDLMMEKQKTNAFLISNGKGELIFNNSTHASLDWKNEKGTATYSLIPYDPKKMKTSKKNQTIYNGERAIQNQLGLIGDTNYQISFAGVQTVQNKEVYRYLLIPSGQVAGGSNKEAFFEPKTGTVSFQNSK